MGRIHVEHLVLNKPPIGRLKHGLGRGFDIMEPSLRRGAAAKPRCPISFPGRIAEQVPLLGLRIPRRDLLEAGKNRIERPAKTVDREIAREHRALSAEHGDNFLHDPAIVVYRPGATVSSQSGNLDTDIWRGCEPSHGGTPTCQTGALPVW